jgi:hypothetical protein
MAFLGLRLGPNVQYDSYTQSLANLSQLQWNQATQGFYPYENQMVQYAEDPNYIASQRTQAQGGADAAMAAQQAGQVRQLGLMGVNPTAPQAAAMAKSSALGKAQAEAGAMNMAAQGAYANQQAALRGT